MLQQFNDVPTMFQPGFNDVLRIFQGCSSNGSPNNRSDLVELKGCSKYVSRVFQERLMLVFHWCFIGVSLLSYRCFKCVFFVPKSLQLPEHKEGLFNSMLRLNFCLINFYLTHVLCLLDLYSVYLHQKLLKDIKPYSFSSDIGKVVSIPFIYFLPITSCK